MDHTGFSFYMPFQKSLEATAGGGSRRVLEGIASTEGLDMQGERVVQKGMDIEPFLSRGYIDWDHGQKHGPSFIIGKPLEGRVETHRGGPALYLKGMLWDHGHEGADAAWDLINAVEKSNDQGPERHLGWSVYGAVTDRDGPALTTSVLTHMALTHQPVNTETFAAIAKSLAAGALAKTFATGSPEVVAMGNPANPGYVTPTILQHLAGGRMSLAAIRLALYGPCDYGHLDPVGQFAKGRAGALEHLVRCRGEEPGTAREFLADIYRTLAR